MLILYVSPNTSSSNPLMMSYGKKMKELLFFMATLWQGSRVAVSDFRSGLRRCKAQLFPIQLSDIIVPGVLLQLKLYFRVSVCQSRREHFVPDY